MAPIARGHIKRNADTDKESLYIAITALVLSSFLAILQFILSYVTSSANRQKTNAAALGEWAKHTKIRPQLWKFKLTVRYAIMDLTVDQLWENRMQQMKHAMVLHKYQVHHSIQSVKDKDGVTVTKIKIILHYQDKEGSPPDSELTREERRAVAALEAIERRLGGAKSVVRCSASMLAADLGFDLRTMKPKKWEDADKIPLNCNTPLFTVRASDLIKFGLLCGLSLENFEIEERKLSMNGPQNYIFTEDVNGVGSVCRYVAITGSNVTPVATCPIASGRSLVSIASGSLCIAEFILSYQFFGFNTIYLCCQFVLGEVDEVIGKIPEDDDKELIDGISEYLEKAIPKLPQHRKQVLVQGFLEMRSLLATKSAENQCTGQLGELWKEFNMHPIKKLQRGDGEKIWKGRWANPATPSVALIMATVSNPSCANGFPHELLTEWATFNDESAQHATRALQPADVVTSPPDFLLALINKHVIKSSDYNIVDNFGCEYGGLRSWIGTNLAEFVHMVTPLWGLPSAKKSGEAADDSSSACPITIVVEPPSDPDPSTVPVSPISDQTVGETAVGSSDVIETRLSYPPIPILNELYPVLRSSDSLASWVKSYNLKPIEGDHTSMLGRAVLWVQITLLDAWIGPAIDRMMGGTTMREVPVPATNEDAEECYKASIKIKQTTAWNLVRARWLMYYTRRLAEGKGEYGDSFLSKHPQPDLHKRWIDMEVGEPHEWLLIDAALTIRAYVLYSMLMSMNDTSVLQQLARNDPLLFIS